MQLHHLVEQLREECADLRRELHKIPEISFQERKTQAFLMSYLLHLEPDSIEKIADTGVKAVFYAKHAVTTVAFRADIDALTIAEETDTPYASQHIGRMHACGHDGHMTILLLTAKLVSACRKSLRANVVLLFQPAEEGGGGALRMIGEGALQNPSVERIYGLHVWPSVPKGKIGLRWGPMMAQTCEFDMVVRGRSAHGASPQMGVDAIVAAAELISMLQTVITRSIDPHVDALLTIGSIVGGSARNVIADMVVMGGTLRVFSEETRRQIVDRIDAILTGVTTATGAPTEFHELIRYPCVDNPRYLVEDFYQYMDMQDIVIVDPVMAAEDYSFYQQHVPGLFLFLGIGDDKAVFPLHNCRFDFDEDALLYGVEIYRRILCIE